MRLHFAFVALPLRMIVLPLPGPRIYDCGEGVGARPFERVA